jgi:hypothetical protein
MNKPSIIHSDLVKWIAVALAVVAAAAYLLIAFNLLGVGDVHGAEKPPAIIFVAAGCYLLGGMLILLGKRWLWVAGALINVLVVTFFYSMYQNRLSVILSPGGLITKVAQILL